MERSDQPAGPSDRSASDTDEEVARAAGTDIDADLLAGFEAVEAQLEGLSGEQLRRAATSLHFDSDGQPRVRRLRALPDPDCLS